MTRHNLLSIDWWLLTPVMILVIISLTTLFSINPVFFRSQLIYTVIALGMFYFFAKSDYQSLKYFSLPIYIAAIVCLGIVLVIGIESRGAVRWIDLLGIRIQFSEIFKPFLAAAFASFLSERDQTSFKTYVLSLVLLAPIALLIMLQPDLGSALIYMGVTFFTMVLFGFPLLWFGLSALPVLLSLPVLWELLHEYQRQRIMTFLHPSNDPLKTSYNVIQAVIAIGSGMLWGKGFSEGTQSALRFLPERQTDFIFATLSEGLGFIGATLVLACFVVICYRMFSIYRQAETTYSKLLAGIAFLFMLVQFFINMGMNLGVLPIVGVTLPFVSFGGSSLLSNFILIGIISSISTSLKKKDVLQIR